MTTIRPAAVIAACLCLADVAAAANELSMPVVIDMPAMPLSEALKQLAREAGLQVVFYSKQSDGLTARRLSGEFTADLALRQLLQGTGLTYEVINSNTVAIIAKDAEAGTTPINLASPLRLAQASEEPSRPTSAPNARVLNSTELEEVVVTAQKREERLQDVPISMSVLQGTELDRSTAEGITEILNRVPGAATTVGVQSGGTQITLRGVTAAAPLFQGSSPIAYYLDSAPFGLVKTAVAPDASSYDLQRVEVLRGPQGTLYGASAQNGVVRVLTHDADLDQLEVKARTSISSTEDGGENYRGDLAVNVPLVEGKLAARAVVGYQDLSGWIDRPNNKDANDAEISTMRLKVNVQPSEALSIGVSAWLSRSDFGSPSTSNDLERHGSLTDEPITTDYDLFSVKVGYDFPAFTFSSMTSYLDYENDSGLDLTPGAPPLVLTTALTAKIFSQEFVLNSTHEGNWRWSAGAAYRDGEDRLAQPFVFLDHTDSSESLAVFGELTRLLLDGRFELTGGLRYFEDDVTGQENRSYTGDPNAALQRSSETFDALSPRVVLTWHANRDLTLYGSYAEGFRSGFDQYANIRSTLPEATAVDADTLTNYELGAKGSVLGGLISFDAAVYYIDWQDVQQGRTVDFNGVPFNVNINGDSASGVGVDLGLIARPARGLEIGANFSWNDLTMDSDVISSNLVLFQKGDRLNLSPEYTIGAFADYVRPIGRNGYMGRFSLSVNHNSELVQRSIVGGLPKVGTGDDITIARASCALESSNSWTVSLFADNLTNERGATAALYAPFPPEWDSRVRPRTVGMQLEFRFQ